jgi:uncharacterized protein (DUF58 family)
MRPETRILLPDDLVRELRYIELGTGRRIRSLRPGAYTSRLKGDGVDFDRHRHYAVGDDVRRIDWNVTARIGQPFVREMYAERELDLVVAIDLSRSMNMASDGRSKREAQIRVTASLLFSAMTDRISTGFVAFTDRVLRWVTPTANSRRAWAALSELYAVEAPSGPTLLVPAVVHLLRSLKRPTLIVIVSDFLVRENLSSTAELAALAARHDVVAVILSDKLEARLPEGSGFVRVRDLESGVERAIRLNDTVRAQYAATVERRREELARCCYRLGIEPLFVDAVGDVVTPLVGAFARRR